MLASKRLWLGTAVTVVFLALLLVRVDLGEMRSALADANYAYLIPAIGVYFVSLYFRAFRWRFLLRPFARLRTARLYPVVLVGYTANNLLPMRLGEIARSYYLAQRERVRGSTALATIITERVFDGIFLLFLLAVTAVFLPVSGLFDRVSDNVNLPAWAISASVIAPFVGVLAVMISMAVRPAAFERLALRISERLPERWGGRVYALVERFIAGFEDLHRPRRLATIVVLTAPVWAAEGVMYYLVALGFGLQDELPSMLTLVGAIAVITSVSNLATSLPSSQGAVGPFEFFTVLSLEFVGVDTGVAAAYAIVLHLALLLPVIAVGLVHLATRSVSLRQLTSSPSDPTDGEEIT